MVNPVETYYLLSYWHLFDKSSYASAIYRTKEGAERAIELLKEEDKINGDEYKEYGIRTIVFVNE